MTLRDALFTKRLQQKTVAKEANCSNRLLSAHIHGRRKMTKEYAERIAAALGAKLGRRNGAWDFVFKSKAGKPAKSSA